MQRAGVFLAGAVVLYSASIAAEAVAQDSRMISQYIGEEICTFFSTGCFQPGCEPPDNQDVLERTTQWHNVWGELNCPHGGLTQYSYFFVEHSAVGSCNYALPCSPVFTPAVTWDTWNQHHWEQVAWRYTLIPPHPGEGAPGICVRINDSVQNIDINWMRREDGCFECTSGQIAWCLLNDGWFEEITCTCRQTPVLLDLDGDGFALTKLANGVLFDLAARGEPQRVSWTRPGSDDGFLALDRNGNGIIDDGAELFGNAAPQPREPGRHGFKALAVFDKTGEGGNEDGKISAADAVFRHLLVWVDRDHDGRSGPGEIRRMASLGVAAIDLRILESRRRDEHGNLFRYRAKMQAKRPVNPWAVDVYLAVGACTAPTSP